MEVEFVEEEETFPADDYTDLQDYSAFEGERCGICMDIVIDRGVLDCCQHWYCFACIDNWSTVTNLCPLCQKEVHFITCVPVYDTIGSNKADEDSYSRDDDWSIEGKSNTLSFPSYYIDEDAVICLDGAGCKIRNGSAALEEDPNLDTSIACDSCDIWYHALCVGYDPEGNCENSWLCPRCVVNGLTQTADGVSVSRPSHQPFPEIASAECLDEAAFSGRVSVSVADAGETAVVVSMIDRNQGSKQLSGNVSPALDVNMNLKTNKLILSSDAKIPQLEMLSSEGISMEPNLEAQELDISSSPEISFSLPSNPLVLCVLKTNTDEKAASEPNVLEGFGNSSRELSGEPCSDELLESRLNLHIGSSAGSSLSVDKVKNEAAEDQLDGNIQLKCSLEERLLPADKIMPDEKDNIGGPTVKKRRHRDYRIGEDGEIKAETETKASAKKVKAGENMQLLHSKDQGHESTSVNPPLPSLIAGPKDDKRRCVLEREKVAANIMDIVRAPFRRSLKQPAGYPAGMRSQERESTAGLRVKKIMRRAAEDKESSMLVQKLRKDIREAVRNKSSKEDGENIFDPKLLAAFRGAMGGAITETKHLLPVDLNAKKLLLQKGKTRENLTKKIYGIGGRRRRAWTRDCEIEFWKHRCLKYTRPEKVEALMSVLDLLRRDSESTDGKYGNEGEQTTSIVSRLYLADTSVFPRKDDVKPFSVLEASGIHKPNKEHSLTVKSSAASVGNFSAKSPLPNESLLKGGVSSSHNKGTMSSVPNIKGETVPSKIYANKPPERPSVSALGGSKRNPPKDVVGKSNDIKSDKRKWALEVLARKTAVSGTNGAQEKQEDNVVVKGNYPLLAQLPADMRPVLAPSRHNKIPISIRQAQLYRLVEHFLRKTNLPVIRRTAETELAVADAINIEKEVSDRSNSKLVYVNLCSQELRSHSINTGKAAESHPSSTPAVSAEVSEQAANALYSDPVAEEALRAAGLLSDSPPNSPHHEMEKIKEEVDPSNKIEEGPDNVIEIDSHPELDIYGDFEYDLEDEDFIGAGTATITKIQQEGESKMKLVFSTAIPDTSNDTMDTKDQEKPTVVEPTCGTSDLGTEGHNGIYIKSSTVDSRVDNCPPPNSSLHEGGEEPSLAECEELYGPEVEPLIKKFPEMTSTKPHEHVSGDRVIGTIADDGSNQVVKESEQESEISAAGSSAVGELPHHSQIVEKGDGITKEKRSKVGTIKESDSSNAVSKKVEAYVKEHIRPLCNSGVITVDQYRWAVGKTTEKVMKYHSKAKNAHFLIKEGEKVKKLAEQYVEAAQWKDEDLSI